MSIFKNIFSIKRFSSSSVFIVFEQIIYLTILENLFIITSTALYTFFLYIAGDKYIIKFITISYYNYSCYESECALYTGWKQVIKKCPMLPLTNENLKAGEKKRKKNYSEQAVALIKYSFS